jgi:GMP synthase-like glutamine amidotransferase
MLLVSSVRCLFVEERPVPRCLVLQHVAPEPPYALADALALADVDIDLRRIHHGDAVPDDIEDYDGLIVMGGPMSAASDDGFPSRVAEIALIESALASGTPTLGVCLGAQLLAAAAGARVYPGAGGPEIGWGPVVLSEECEQDDLLQGLPRVPEVMHWHGDTFDLPDGAALLASNDRYVNQAFRVGDRAWGLQFHLEVTADAVAAFVAAFGEELVRAGIDPQAILAATPGAIERLAETQRAVIDRFANILVTSALNVATKVV